jgi:DNA-binding winged helix-turn-helix (wHTH) protein
MTTHTCPQCGTSVQNATAHGVTFVAATGVVTFEGRTCVLRPMQLDILEHLLDAFPRGMSVPKLFALIYSDRSDGEEPVSNALGAHISDMRRRFRDAGVKLVITNRKGWGERSEYVLALDASEEPAQQVA